MNNVLFLKGGRRRNGYCGGAGRIRKGPSYHGCRGKNLLCLGMEWCGGAGFVVSFRKELSARFGSGA